MLTIVAWTRALLAALALAVFTPVVSADSPSTEKSAQRNTGPDRPRTTSRSDTDEKRPTGSPEFGILILIGAVGFIILIAWIIARLGDDNRPRSDKVVG
jgi:hypothetical protein